MRSALNDHILSNFRNLFQLCTPGNKALLLPTTSPCIIFEVITIYILYFYYFFSSCKWTFHEIIEVVQYHLFSVWTKQHAKQGRCFSSRNPGCSCTIFSFWSSLSITLLSPCHHSSLNLHSSSSKGPAHSLKLIACVIA